MFRKDTALPNTMDIRSVFRAALIFGIGAGSGVFPGLLTGGAIVCAVGIYGGLISGLVVGWWITARLNLQTSSARQS